VKTEMNCNNGRLRRATMLTALVLLLVVTSSQLRADSGTCSGAPVNLPFTDVQGNTFFCQIAAAYFSGLTNGTSATTYSPTQNVPREQMAAFVSRTLDQSLRRGSRRAALGQFWSQQVNLPTAETSVGEFPRDVKSDGADLWVTSLGDDTVTRVRASDGKVLGIWTGANGAHGILVANGRVYVTGGLSHLYAIDPESAPGPVFTLSSNVGTSPRRLAFDGKKIWILLQSGFSIFNPLTAAIEPSPPSGFSSTTGILFDGTNIWIIDSFTNTLNRMNENGTIAQTVPVGGGAGTPVFDGTNIWVPNFFDDSVTVVRASTGQVLATLTGNGLNSPQAAAFDGERVLIVNGDPGDSVSLWKAADLSPISSLAIGAPGVGVCSDGLNFWIITNTSPGKLIRF
jgi:hypothetical protein